MHEPPPTENSLFSLRKVIKDEFQKLPNFPTQAIELAPPELADEVLDLYYSGHAKIAQHFYDSCWPKNRPGKNDFWSFMMNQAKQRQFWPEIEKMNHLKSRNHNNTKYL